MADLSATMPDGHLEAFDVYLGNSNASAGDRTTAISAWLQGLVDQELWNMARQAAAAAVADPTA